MSDLHKAFNDAESAGSLVEREPADPGLFKTKPKIRKKPSSWESMPVHEKLRWVKINGSTSELPVSVEVARLINEGKIKTFKNQLLRSELIRKGGIVRVLISPGEFVLFQQRIIHAGLKHSEKVNAREHIRLDEIGYPVEDTCSEDESSYDPTLSMNRRVYGGLKKIRASQLDRLNCKVQIIMSTSKERDSFHFSGVLTYECLLTVLAEIKIASTDIERFKRRVVEKHLEAIGFSKPLKAGKLVHDIDVPCDPCFNHQ